MKGSKLNLSVIFSLLCLVQLTNAVAKPVDDYLANEQTHLTTTAQEGRKQQVSTFHSSSKSKDFGLTRKVIVLPKTGTVEAVIPKYDPNAPKTLAIPEDTNQDGAVSPLDALIVINYLNARNAGQNVTFNPALDVNKDGNISPIDVLLVVNTLNRNRNGQSTISKNLIYDPSIVMLTDKDGGGDVQVVYDNDQFDFNSIKYNSLNANLLAGGADSFLIPVAYASTNDSARGNLIKIEVFSDQGSKSSVCPVPLPPTTTVNGIVNSKYEIKVSFKNCTGSADFASVNAIRLTLLGEKRGGLDLRILNFKTNGTQISSAEDVSVSEESVTYPTFDAPHCVAPCGCDAYGNPLPSGPCGCDLNIVDLGCGCGIANGPCGCDLSIKDVGCGCGKPGPSGCDNLCGSTATVDECGQCKGPGKTGCDHQCGSTKKFDVCNVCDGPGTDNCGNCGTGPFLPEKTPNRCGACGEDNMICNYCKDDPNRPVFECGCDTSVKDLGCGCGKPGPSGCDNKCGSTKVPGCDGVCGSDKVADACGVCGGDGRSCRSCKYVEMNFLGYPNFDGNREEFRTAKPEEPCIKKIMDEAKWICEGNGLTSQSGDSSRADFSRLPWFENVVSYPPWGSDDCIHTYITMAYLGGHNDIALRSGGYINSCGAYNDPRRDPISNAGLFGAGKSPEQAFRELFQRLTDATTGPGARTCLADIGLSFWSSNHYGHSWYLDQQTCKPIGMKDTDLRASPSEVCALVTYAAHWTPISLVMDDSKDQDVKITRAELMNKNKFVHWQGSGNRPLLVYDPSESNEVRSLDQLFGDRTFGGKNKYASIDNANISIFEPWKNGYEALATLDLNKDGAVNDRELDAIALWFDKNQDAIAQKEEVVRAKNFGITKLFYSNPVLESKNFNLKVGYELVSDGKKKIGSSIDWVTDQYETYAEAVSALSLKNIVSFKEGIDVKKEEPLSNTNEAAKSVLNSKEGYGGTWDWYIGNNPDGFAISENDLFIGKININESNTGIKGYYYQTVPVSMSISDETQEKKALYFVAKKLKGDKLFDKKEQKTFIVQEEKNENGKIVVKFSVEDGLLKGKTYQAIKGSAPVTYYWYAKRN